MLLLEKIQNEKFSDSQQGVIDFILEHKFEIRDMTIRQIAAKCYTSNATLIRIAHKLGFVGWEEFKKEFLAEQEYLSTHFSNIDPNIPFSKTDSVTSIANKVAELKKEAIDDTLSLINVKDLHKAADIICHARLVNVLGSHNTQILGQLFALKLGRIHKRCHMANLHGEDIYSQILLDPDTCCVVISYSGETGEILRHMEAIHQARRPIILITSIGESSAVRLADVVLRICTREKMYSKISWYTTEAAIEYILDLLYSIIFWKNYEENLEFKLSVAKSIESHRTSSSWIIAEKENA